MFGFLCKSSGAVILGNYVSIKAYLMGTAIIQGASLKNDKLNVSQSFKYKSAIINKI